MRRWTRGLALVGAVTLTLSGCTGPAGVDGNLTDDWAVPGKPTTFVPQAGTCHLDLPTIGYPTSYRPVDCTTTHLSETIHVGSFSSEAASRSRPPLPDSREMEAAFAECDAKSEEYLGGSWRSARLVLSMTLPSDKGWSGGSRWFRCDLAEIPSVYLSNLPRQRTGSLRGGPHRIRPAGPPLLPQPVHHRRAPLPRPGFLHRTAPERVRRRLVCPARHFPGLPERPRTTARRMPQGHRPVRRGARRPQPALPHRHLRQRS